MTDAKGGSATKPSDSGTSRGQEQPADTSICQPVISNLVKAAPNCDSRGGGGGDIGGGLGAAGKSAGSGAASGAGAGVGGRPA